MTCCTSAKWVGPAKTALQLCKVVHLAFMSQLKTKQPPHMQSQTGAERGDTVTLAGPRGWETHSWNWILRPSLPPGCFQPPPHPPTSPSSSSLLLIHSRVPPGRPGHQYDTQKECVGSGTSTRCLCHSNPRINLCKFCPLPPPPTAPPPPPPPPSPPHTGYLP